jgi:hypothetical protein
MNIQNTEDLALALNEVREKHRVYKRARKSYKKNMQKEFTFQLNSRTIEYKFYGDKKTKSAESIFSEFLRNDNPTFISSRRRSTGPDTPIYSSTFSA